MLTGSPYILVKMDAEKLCKSMQGELDKGFLLYCIGKETKNGI